jgi:uncharacterized protein (TIGR04255 family)
LIDSPFGDEPLDEVPLPRAPLVNVVAQVRFPQVTSLTREDGVAPLAEALAKNYPVLRRDKEVAVVFTPDGVLNQPSEGPGIWRLQDKDGNWQVSVSSQFISLDTASYTSRSDFFDRFSTILTVFANTMEPAIADRVGVRYLDRIEGASRLGRLHELVRPEVMGALAIPQGNASLSHSVTESVFNLDDHQLLGRWGVLPSGAVVDQLVPPSSEVSWILDLDAFAAGRLDFNAEQLASRARGFSERIYRFFRWAVTKDFLIEYGAEL